MPFEISVSICTYNRSQLLLRALDSLLSQTLHPDNFEILIVDNGSTDATSAVVARYQTKQPTIRYVRELNAGVAHARNKAIQEAAGKYLAFLDDDALAESQWLEELIKPFHDSRLKATPACVVGPVILQWEGKGRPDWFPARFESLLCQYDLGSESHFLSADGYLLTTNVLFDRAILKKIGGFNTSLGRKRGKLLGGEDNDICQRLLRAGRQIFYQPSALVHHAVPPERQTRHYLLNRLFWDGASQPLLALSKSSTEGNSYHPWVEAGYDLRRFGRSFINLSKNLILFRQYDAWEDLFVADQALGRLRTDLGLSFGMIK